MPLYEYKCVKCGHRFEKIEGVSSSVTKKCPKCGRKAARLASAPAIQFKGSGWYVTDYAAKKSGAESKEGSGDGAASKEASGDGAASKPPEKAAESKPAAEKEPAKKKK